MSLTIITISRFFLGVEPTEPQHGEFFFSKNHCQPTDHLEHGADWVPCTTSLPITVVERAGLEDGLVDTLEKYLLVFHTNERLIANPDPDYKVDFEDSVLASRAISVTPAINFDADLIKLDSGLVKQVFMYCLFSEEEVDAAEMGNGFIEAHGVVAHVGFHPGRVKQATGLIEKLLDELPDDFKQSIGGGWTFLNACNDKHGNQWTGFHRSMDELVCLGLAIGKVEFQMTRDMWSILPGGVPYFSVKDVSEVPTPTTDCPLVDACERDGDMCSDCHPDPDPDPEIKEGPDEEHAVDDYCTGCGYEVCKCRTASDSQKRSMLATRKKNIEKNKEQQL